MGKGYPDMAGWGVPAIFKEAARLVRSYLRLLHPFIAAFLLPVALIVLLGMISLPPPDAPPRFAAFLHHHRRHRHDRHDHFGFNAFIASLKASEEYQPQPPSPLSPLIQTLISLALIIAIWLLVSLATAAIAKAVQSIYTTSDDEENPSATVKAIFKSLPAAFFRIFITSLWILLLDLILNTLVALPFYLLSLTNTIDHHLLLNILQASLLLGVLTVDFLFILSLQVAVLEPENYGLAGVKRAVKLVQVKISTALTLFVIYSGFGLLFSWIVQGVAAFLTNGELYVSAVSVAGGYVAFATYWLVVTTVFYFASKRECGDDDERAGVTDSENAYRPIAAENF